MPNSCFCTPCLFFYSVLFIVSAAGGWCRRRKWLAARAAQIKSIEQRIAQWLLSQWHTVSMRTAAAFFFIPLSFCSLALAVVLLRHKGNSKLKVSKEQKQWLPKRLCWRFKSQKSPGCHCQIKITHIFSATGSLDALALHGGDDG